MAALPAVARQDVPRTAEGIWDAITGSVADLNKAFQAAVDAGDARSMALLHSQILASYRLQLDLAVAQTEIQARSVQSVPPAVLEMIEDMLAGAPEEVT